ncbi:MAG: 4-(cytidine 5'-diphospho)-2-C-methyl-D-erythritol kinase [Firmicutes bacterium]|nr:4-(cytidine 5'-diphospho)-2-C-methyl-D-erythritol kinase [Bacillota bacterium]MCL1954131.1 4-(cytidine 5'-diphospho)-2-C-methyl-D-erythritol kinase [Bacillota bacterium]
MSTYTTKVHAKINLSLKVVGVLSNGYHALDSILCSINELYDTVSVSKRDDEQIVVKTVCGDNFPTNQVLQLQTELNSIPSKHTAFRMAHLLQQEFGLCGVNIVVKKGIPMYAGLGGSSAAAAGVLIAFDNLFCLKLSSIQALNFAKQIGEDVPFMLYGGVARQRDLDKKIAWLDTKICPQNIIVLSHSKGISTQECFKKYAQLCAKSNDILHNDTMTEILCSSVVDLNKDFYVHIDNDLLQSAKILDYKIEQSLQLLKYSGAIACSMSGSGSTCFGFYDKQNDLNAIVEKFKMKKDSQYCYVCSVFGC